MGQTASGAFDGSGTGVFTGGSIERPVTCRYDFTKQGGLIGNIVIGKLPLGSAIIGGDLSMEAALVGGGASAGITAEAAGDIVAVAVVSGAPWSTTGNKAILPKINTPEGASTVTATADRDILLVISGANLTAGRFELRLRVRNPA